MAMEKEALTHKIEDDLAARNRNWDKVTSHLAEITPQDISSSFSRVVGTSGSIYARYIPFLNMVWLSFNIIGITEDSTSSLTVITFDTEYAPIATVRDTIRGTSRENGLGLASITDSGSIVVNMDSDQSVLRGICTWFTT